MARLPRKVREINDFNATDWFEKLLQRTTIEMAHPSGVGHFYCRVSAGNRGSPRSSSGGFARDVSASLRLPSREAGIPASPPMTITCAIVVGQSSVTRCCRGRSWRGRVPTRSILPFCYSQATPSLSRSSFEEYPGWPR